MKLRYLFFSLMALIAFGACSNEDDIIDNNIPKEPVDAYISFVAKSNTQTRSITDGKGEQNLNNETKITRLTALIFDAATRKRVAYQDETNQNGISEIKDILIKVTPVDEKGGATNDKFYAVLVANATDNVASIYSMDDFNTVVVTKSCDQYQVGDVLPMASDTIQFTGVRPTVKKTENGTTQTTKNENWIKSSASAFIYTEATQQAAGTIALNRLVARIQVDKITVSFQEETYKNAEFKLTRLWLANARSVSSINSINNPSYVYYKGYESAMFDKLKPEERAGWIQPGSEVKTGLRKGYTGNYVTGLVGDWTDNSAIDKFFRYTFANPGKGDNVNVYETALVISGFFKNAGIEEERHFRVLLKDNDEPIKVKSNHVYRIEVIITGEGSRDEDNIEMNAYVSATVVANPWQTVDQAENDAN